MNIEDARKKMNKKFKYKYDSWLDKWTIMDVDAEYMHGDCEDWSLTYAWLISDRNIFKFMWGILTFRFIFWFIKMPSGGGHVIIYVRDTGMYIDNIQKEFKTKDELKDRGYNFKFPMILPFFLIKMLVRYTIGLFVK